MPLILNIVFLSKRMIHSKFGLHMDFLMSGTLKIHFILISFDKKFRPNKYCGHFKTVITKISLEVCKTLML